ncbi:glycosyl hydrolase [Isosphaeraceae bacterium EP7]
MLATWIESAAKGRHGGPVRSGIWSSAVVGTHPIETGQEVWLELAIDDVEVGPLPAYWIENKGVNSLWHVPIPPQAVGSRLHYRASAKRGGDETTSSPYQDTMVRPNLPDRTDTGEVLVAPPEGLAGNRMMTARIDDRGSTYDLYFPTVGLHSNIRPAEGEQPQSRSNFRSIVAGLALGQRLEWFAERHTWHAFQHYLGATNVLMTELTWRHGPIRVLATDFVAMGHDLPRTAGGTESPGQYVKRFRVFNDGDEPRQATFGFYVQAEVNGGVGEPGLSWHDGDRALLVSNRGHGHANRKLARDATVEFSLGLDDRGAVHCEPTGPNEALLLRRLDLPAGQSVTVDLLVSGAFTGWRGDLGTYEHWLRPALNWFRSADLDAVEQATAQEWDAYVEPLPSPNFPKPGYAVNLRRSALVAALHCDAQWGAIAAGFDRGLSAYCWPRDAMGAGAALDRAGHPEIGRGVYRWLSRVRGQNRPYSYWYQKYTIDGWPEWESPAVDQTAMIPWGLERHYRRTGDLGFVSANWPMIEQAASVCGGESAHPGLRMIEELNLLSSAGIWDIRFGAFFYSNCAAVAGLRAAARLARILDRAEQAEAWEGLADRIWEQGILRESSPGDPGPGLVDPVSGRFLNARRVSTFRGLWTDRPESLVDRSMDTDISVLGAVIPFGLLPASDPRIRRSVEAILKKNALTVDPNLLTRWSQDPFRPERSGVPIDVPSQDVSSLATLWMARYLLQLGRETGQAAYWLRALAMLDSILNRLGPLGVLLRPTMRVGEIGRRGVAGTAGVWGLHGMILETILDLAGLDYDAIDGVISLKPVLPPSWPQVGMSQVLPCGPISYRFDRPIGGTVHQLTFTSDLTTPARLDIHLTCIGLTSLGPWQSDPEGAEPILDRSNGGLAWTVDLPVGPFEGRWAWG